MLAWFALGLLVVWGVAKRASGSAEVRGAVRSVKGPSGVSYEAISRPGDTFEVVRRDHPTTFIVFGQGGEIDAKGDEDELAVMRADMQKFPPNLFGWDR